MQLIAVIILIEKASKSCWDGITTLPDFYRVKMAKTQQSTARFCFTNSSLLSLVYLLTVYLLENIADCANMTAAQLLVINGERFSYSA